MAGPSSQGQFVVQELLWEWGHPGPGHSVCLCYT